MLSSKDIFRQMLCIMSSISVTKESQNQQILSDFLIIFTALSVTTLLCKVGSHLILLMNNLKSDILIT